ncbi:uncharacterized protein LOC126473624 [Schistocerca serialis cubense]|uniref:uncharacterized protein LOC126473624 n=1 Tax=Schistocerca serialis cubense TaxID=2023355 RepID=UPI00214E11E2|nr:uncharacterized protein LOC126473624 [Schistocerca serialis cubense]
MRVRTWLMLATLLVVALWAQVAVPVALFGTKKRKWYKRKKGWRRRDEEEEQEEYPDQDYGDGANATSAALATVRQCAQAQLQVRAPLMLAGAGAALLHGVA